MEVRLRDGTTAVCHGARYFAPREPLERAASSDELRAAMRAAIERATAPRSTPEAIRQAEAAIREDAKDRVYSSDDLRALWRLAALRGGH